MRERCLPRLGRKDQIGVWMVLKLLGLWHILVPTPQEGIRAGSLNLGWNP